MSHFDLFIIGGGINGTGIARDAAGRGLRVGLCEKDDLGAHTSSASTKLIHGGLRYLEHREFRLVRKSLRERETLLHSAPHIIWPLEFVLPHHRGLRPAWVLRAGLALYDLLGGRTSLPRSGRVDLRSGGHAGILQSCFRRGFRYFDCWVEDARLVVLNAIDAADRGARIMPRVRFEGARRGQSAWEIQLRHADGQPETLRATTLVNAAGPWIDRVDDRLRARCSNRSVRLVRGSHIILDKLYPGDHAYLFQNADGRILFAIPYENDYTLLGTTEVAVDDPETGARVSKEEEDYLLAAAGSYFETPISRSRIIGRYAGIRPLHESRNDAPTRISRDYTLELDRSGAALLTVVGGKITTYRRLAEDAMRRLAPLLPPCGPAWTANAVLPGGEFGLGRFEACVNELASRFAFVERTLLRRLVRAYGSRADRILGRSLCVEDLGEYFGAGLYEAELRYLVCNEFAATAEDVLWRRSKLGLHISPAARARVEHWFEAGRYREPASRSGTRRPEAAE